MWNDSNFLFLDRLRITINVLKKSDFCRNPNTVCALSIFFVSLNFFLSLLCPFLRFISQEEGTILSSLKELQLKLRSYDNGYVQLTNIVQPFSLILKNSNFSAPFKLTAIESLQTFIKSHVFSEFQPVSSNSSTGSKSVSALVPSAGDTWKNDEDLKSALKEIVIAVTTCKFVQTDNHSDELLQLQLLKTVYYLILHIPPLAWLDICWDTIHFCLKTMTSTGKTLAFFLSLLW
jgi:hypothetical protein